MEWFFFIAALVGGVANPFQSGTNAQLNKELGKPLWATIFVYALGLAILLTIQVFARQSLPEAKLSGVSWWAWLGAPVSLISTFVALSVAQKMGSGLFTAATVTASLITSILLDHFGLLGFKQHAANPARMGGCALLVLGVWIIARF